MPKVRDLIDKAQAQQGLLPEEVRVFFNELTADDWPEIFEVAKKLTAAHFHKDIYFFAPLYFSSCCVNDCLYCGFRRNNLSIARVHLSGEEFLREAEFLWREGHRSLLLVAAEHPHRSGPLWIAEYLNQLMSRDYVFDISLEVGPFDVSVYHELKEMGVKRCVLHQETYDRKTYASLHKGPKEDFDWRYDAMGRARLAGIENIGLGILLGLYSYREDFLALVQHAQALEVEYGQPPATLSFPRIRPVHGTENFKSPFAPVTDETFEKMIALARLALPRTGITLTTRETPEFRNRLCVKGIGITHVSAGASTVPGGYVAYQEDFHSSQFDISDRRSLNEMVCSVQEQGYRPKYRF